MKKVYLFLWLFLAGYKPSYAQYGACTAIDYIKAPTLSSSLGNGYGSKGMAISADGNTLAVGNPQESYAGMRVNPAFTGTANGSGAVFIYRRSDSLSPWVYQAYLKASNTITSGLFGSSLALSADGTTLAVG
ncbi:MAG: hypothetical protein QM530_08820, partial [Phycisphaerales bacterium]|nr:hypothetical protein [Phycisphaerales bacterium]